MFEVIYDLKNEPFLRWNPKYRPDTRGKWVKVAHSNEKLCNFCVQVNRDFGLEVLVDEDGYYRALIYRD